MEALLQRGLDGFSSVAGPFLIAIALALILFCTYVFFVFTLTYYSLYVKILLSLTGMFILFNALYNYYKSIVVSPGVPPLAFESMEGAFRYRSALANRLRNYKDISDDDVSPSSNSFVTCSKCERIRPPRTHHCSVCKSCIFKYDHHCPWIYNCVGLYNYKFFYLFLLHIFLVDSFFIAASYPVFQLAMETPYLVKPELRANVTMAVFLACGAELALAAFVCFHTYLIITNQTTMEWATGANRDTKLRCSRPFDLGRSQNWEQIFGYRFGNWRWAFSFLHDNIEPHERIPSFPAIEMAPVSASSNAHIE